MKCVCVEDKEHECIQRNGNQYECKEVKKYRFNCMTQYVDKIVVLRLFREMELIPITFSCEDSSLRIVELNPKMYVIRETKNGKVLQVWV